MTDKEKVTQKEIDKAMNSFMKNAAMPPGMASPLMAMMGQSGMVNTGTLPVAQSIPTMPAPMMNYQMNPYAYQQMNQQMMMPSQQNYKAVGLGSRVRLGNQKHRDFGTCAECAKMTAESKFNADGSGVEQYNFCNAKNKRVNADGGLIMMEIMINGKPEKQIDREKSCRIFERL